AGDQAAERSAEALLLRRVRPRGAASRQAVAWWRRIHVPAGERSPLPRGRGASRRAARERLRRCPVPAPRRLDRRAAHRPEGRVSTVAGTLEMVHGAPGLADYLEAVEERLRAAARGQPGPAAARRREPSL